MNRNWAFQILEMAGEKVDNLNFRPSICVTLHKTKKRPSHVSTEEGGVASS